MTIKIPNKSQKQSAVKWPWKHLVILTRTWEVHSLTTNHKLLLTIWKFPKPSSRIESWGFRLQPYKPEVTYLPSKENSADYMSRHPVENHIASKEEKYNQEIPSFSGT
jgi:hypothetical protein